MRKKMAVILAAMMILSGCKSNGRQIDASYDADVYKDYMTEENRIDSLNYLVTDKEKNLSLLGNLVDGLVETDRYGNLKPAMAQDIGAANEKSTVWDFSIRGDVAWVDNDGNPTGEFVTADDFICGIQYVLDEAHQSGYRNQLISLIKNAKEYTEGKVGFDEVGVEAVNEYTLRFTLKQSCSYFNTYLLNGGFYPVSRVLLDRVGNDFATSPETMWYNGSYYLESYTEEKITYSRNEQYWEVGQVSFEDGSIVLVEDDNEALDLFKSGKLSYAYVDDTYAEEKGSSIDSHMYMSATDPDSLFYVFNFSSGSENFKKAVANENFRKAIFYGLDPNTAFVTKEADSKTENKTETDHQDEVVNKGQLNASAQSTIIPTDFATKQDGTDYVTLGSLGLFSGSNNYSQEKMNTYQLAAMKDLSGEVTFPVEVRVPVSLDDPQASKEFARLASLYDESFVKLTMVNYTSEEISEAVENSETSTLKSYDKILSSNEYEMMCVSLRAQNGDPSTYLSQLTSDGTLNKTYTHFKDEVYDSLYKAANNFSDNDQRLMTFAECEAYLLDKAYVIPFSHGNLRYKVSSINDYSMPSGTYGLARFKLKGVKALEQALTLNEREELKAAYEEAKNTGI